ncbi:MAG: cytidine deaminase, partial [Firmicutes bacterium]|nr:cytidine deaminase [Bacillota bacterium]
AAAKNAFAPFSNFHVGAALLASDGRIFTGCNVENSSYGATICAERTALVKAVSEGSRDFIAIAVVSQDGEAWPCGICRQVLYEFSPEMLVITGNDEHLDVVKLNELLPHGFRLDR